MTDTTKASGMGAAGRSRPSPRQEARSAPRLLVFPRPRIEKGLAEALRGDSIPHRILRYHVGLEDEEGRPCRIGGKLLRPSLVLFTAGELGEAGDRALAAAVSLELVHEFSLLHDDIEDRDRTRRGRPAAWARFGMGQAVNAGDLMQTLAFALVLEAGPRAAAALADATSTMIEGQGLDLSLEGRRATVEEYLETAKKKTGALFSCAFRLGAIVAGAPRETEAELSESGEEVGLAFQIRDDILGVWGNEEETGKPQGSDLRARKSLLVAMALERATGVEKTALESVCLEPEVSDPKVERVTALLERLGVRDAAEEMAAWHLDRARAILEGVPFRREAREELEELLAYLVGRTL